MIDSVLKHPIVSTIVTILIAWFFTWIIVVQTHIAVADESKVNVIDTLQRIERKVDSIDEHLRGK